MKLFLFALILTLFQSISAQIIPNSDRGKPAEVESAEEMINRITEDSGRFFKEGLMSFQEDRRKQAREKFDKTVEVFLMSGVNVSSNQKLQACYSQLIETVYRIENPSNKQPPQIRSLSATCGWNIDNQLADNVARLTLKPLQNDFTISNDSTLSSAATTKPNLLNDPQPGFTQQKFEPSPLDELAKLQLTPEEENLSPVFLTVRAQTGDTVSKIAAREKVSAVELAKFNGLFPDSILPAGMTIKLPIIDKSVKTPSTRRSRIISSALDAGVRPLQKANGTIPLVINYLNDNLNDPYSVRFVSWSKINKVTLDGVEYWAAAVKLRAKNVYNAYILGEMVFYFRNNKIVQVARIN